MRLPKFLGINRTLAFAILVERWLGLPFVLEGKGLEAYPVPWHWLVIELTAKEVIWLMNVCAECGDRADILFLNEVLTEMLNP